ncbi:MAG: M48 family metalloprotease [Thermomicrobium sp.]|mgnify:FL=1|nr:M48 family metalloprotease [Thermomicrobium sp.]
MTTAPTHAGLPDEIGSALPVTRTQAPALWALVDEVARRLGTTPPDNVLIALGPLSFGTESPVRLVDTTVTGRTLGLSLVLLYLLDEDELRALIAHELDHFRRQDTRPKRLETLFTDFIGTALLVVATVTVRLPDPICALLRPLVRFGLTRFAFWQQARMFERELLADRAAAELAGTAAWASLLVKSALVTAVWSVVESEFLRDLAKQALPLGAVVARATRELFAGSDLPDWLGQPDQPSGLWTHPDIVERLAALGCDLLQVWARARSTKASAAKLLLEDPIALDIQLSDQFARRRSSASSESSAPSPSTSDGHDTAG